MFTGFMVSLINGLVNFILFSLLFVSMPALLVKPEQIAKDQFVHNAEIQRDSSINIAKAMESIHQQFTPGGFYYQVFFRQLLLEF